VAGNCFSCGGATAQPAGDQVAAGAAGGGAYTVTWPDGTVVTYLNKTAAEGAVASGPPGGKISRRV